MNLLEELEGNGWQIQHALLTTYAFDPQFFSGYVRPRLRRRNCDLPVVLVDDRRYEDNIGSPDWLEAPIGSHYLLEPVETGSVFHPKVNLFASERSVFATVSSANLTLEEYCRAAQVGNSIAIQRSWLDDEDYQLGNTYNVVRDIRQFFKSLAEDEQYITGQDASEHLIETVETLEWLDEYDSAGSDRGDEDTATWFLHSLDTPILEQVQGILGEVERVQMYAPFYGSPSVLNDILSVVDPDTTELIVEPESTAIDLDELTGVLEFPFEVREMQHETTRWVHGKFVTFRGPWGAACLFGSPNLSSTALLQNADRGNCEAAFLSVFQGERVLPPGTLYENEAFEFELSPPVEEYEKLTVREQSYEGWETRPGEDDETTRLRLLDARLTKPGSDDVSELILRLEGLSGKNILTVETKRGDVSRRIEPEFDESNRASVTVEIESSDRERWMSSVITVSVGGEDAASNPRLVNEESQPYFREYREMAESEGTRGSTSLLTEILQNPDTTAIEVLDVALSELRKRSYDRSTDVETGPDSSPSFGERPPDRLEGGTSSTPSLKNLVERQLSYHLESAMDILQFDDLPTQKHVTSFLDHLETFFETIELCVVLDLMDELSEDAVLSVCRKQFAEFLQEYKNFALGISRLADLINDNPRVREHFSMDDDSDARELDFWSEAFDSLYIHPAIVLELDYKSPDPIIRSHNEFANRLMDTLEITDPALWRNLFDHEYLVQTIEERAQNLIVKHSETNLSVSITGEALRTILLYTLVQKSLSDSDFLTQLSEHPQLGGANSSELAEFALSAESEMINYGLVSTQQWNIVLKPGRRRVQQLAEKKM